MAFTSLWKRAFDYEHWVDPDLQIRAVRELGLEYIWPLDPASATPEPSPLQRGPAHDTEH